jgi:hypothetical protein
MRAANSRLTFFTTPRQSDLSQMALTLWHIQSVPRLGEKRNAIKKAATPKDRRHEFTLKNKLPSPITKPNYQAK